MRAAFSPRLDACGGRPDAMTAAVPRTGSKAAVPGYGVEALMNRQDSPMAPSPTQPAMSEVAGRRGTAVAVRASTPPTASSHARLGSEKNAHAGAVPVHSRATRNEDTATSVKAVTDTALARRRPTNTAATRSIGQNR